MKNLDPWGNSYILQDADVGTEPPESAVEMRSIWGQAGFTTWRV